MKSFKNWQIDNKDYIMDIYNIILTDLNKYKMEINDKKKLYEDVVFYLYKTIH